MLLGFLMTMIFLVGVFMILLILVQRGKGGGLAGALGGMGGQSAFGNRPTDMFAKITMGTACVWILLCILTVKLLGTEESVLDSANLGGDAAAVDGMRSTTPTTDPTAPKSTAPTGEPEGSPASSAPASSAPSSSAPATSAPATGSPASSTPAAPADK